MVILKRLKRFGYYYLIKDNNASFNLNFGTTDSRILNTKDLFFSPTVTKNGENTIVSMKLKVSESKFLEYRYLIKPNDYMLDFTIRSQGLSDVLNSSQEINLDWELKHTKDLETGTASRSVETQKELMVMPNPPRFLREGDVIKFTAKVSNLTEAVQVGEARLELFDPLSGAHLVC